MVKRLVGLFWKVITRLDKKRIGGQTPPSGVHCEVDIPYIDDGNPMHTLDVYYKEGTSKPQPVIFDIHGGGWVYGNKELNKYFCMQLATHGFTVVNINYRLTTEEVFPACLLDIFAALNWVLKNGKEHFADADKLCIAGDSAGGHLAFTTANVIQNPALQEELGVSFDGKVSALGLICGALDLERYIKLRAFRGYQELVFGQDFMNNPARHIGIPYNYLTKDLPPVYLVSSDKDFARASTLDIKPRLEKLGVPHLCRYITGKTKHKLIHVFNVIHPEWEESIEVNKEMCDFFKKYV